MCIIAAKNYNISNHSHAMSKGQVKKTPMNMSYL
jgi:hypothetical protein